MYRTSFDIISFQIEVEELLPFSISTNFMFLFIIYLRDKLVSLSLCFFVVIACLERVEFLLPIGED